MGEIGKIAPKTIIAALWSHPLFTNSAFVLDLQSISYTSKGNVNFQVTRKNKGRQDNEAYVFGKIRVGNKNGLLSLFILRASQKIVKIIALYTGKVLKPQNDWSGDGVWARMTAEVLDGRLKAVMCVVALFSTAASPKIRSDFEFSSAWYWCNN